MKQLIDKILEEIGLEKLRPEEEKEKEKFAAADVNVIQMISEKND